MIYLYTYLVFAFMVASFYTYLYHTYLMPDTVKKSRFKDKINVYIMLWGSIFLIAPYGLWEIYVEYKRGGLKK